LKPRHSFVYILYYHRNHLVVLRLVCQSMLSGVINQKYNYPGITHVLLKCAG